MASYLPGEYKTSLLVVLNKFFFLLLNRKTCMCGAIGEKWIMWVLVYGEVLYVLGLGVHDKKSSSNVVLQHLLLGMP